MFKGGANLIDNWWTRHIMTYCVLMLREDAYKVSFLSFMLMEDFVHSQS